VLISIVLFSILMREHSIFLNIQDQSNHIIKIHVCGHCRGPEDLLPKGRVFKDRFVIHYFIKGKGIFRDHEGNTYPFKDDHIILNYPKIRHYLSPQKGQELEHYYVEFSGILPKILLKNLSDNSVNIFPIKKSKLFQQKFIEIISAARVPSLTSFHKGNALLYSLINETIVLAKDSTAKNRSDEIVDDFLAFIQQNIQSNVLDTELFCKPLDLSKAQFGKIFKESTGLTPYKFWLSYKIDEAKNLLIKTNKSIKEISAFLGFEDEFYFSRLFKRKEGSSPKFFRESFF
jgi:AraC-like DNA-binding protein